MDYQTVQERRQSTRGASNPNSRMVPALMSDRNTVIYGISNPRGVKGEQWCA